MENEQVMQNDRALPNDLESERSVLGAILLNSECINIVYEKIQELSLTSMSKRSAGNLIHRVTHDTERVKEFF